MGQRIVGWLSALAAALGLVLGLLALNSSLLGQLRLAVLLVAGALALSGVLGLAYEAARLLHWLARLTGLNLSRHGVGISAERHGQWIVLRVTNRSEGDDFHAQLITIAGGDSTMNPHLPMKLRWEDGSDEQHIAHGHTGFVRLVKIHANGIAFINMGKWALEPPLVLEETPTPAGGGMNYVGIYPPLDIRDTSKQTLERLRFDLKARISSDTRSIDHATRFGFWTEPQDLS